MLRKITTGWLFSTGWVTGSLGHRVKFTAVFKSSTLEN